MEVISNLCFGQYAMPEQDLIKMLMQIIFVHKQTRDLTYRKDGKKDKKPTIRSALLQLLLEYRYSIELYSMLCVRPGVYFLILGMMMPKTI